MNKYHAEILAEIKKISQSNPKKNSWFDGSRYMGTSHYMYNVTNPQVRSIVKKWIQKHKNLSREDLIEILNSTFQGESHNERSLGGKLLEYFPFLRKQIDPVYLDKWLTGAEGWGEVDSLCQSSFTAEEILEKWDKWEKILKAFVQDRDVHKRRASLVLLVRSVRESDDPKLSNLAFENIDKLKEEKDILITKAISWLLRSLIANHKKEVADYLNQNQDTLPKICLRETKRKLETGKK